MQVVVNGITAKVEWEGHRKRRTDSGPRVVIRYQVPYAQSDLFADSCMGGIVVTGGPKGTVRNLPRQLCPTNPSLYAISAEIEYFGERDDIATGQTIDGAILPAGVNAVLGFDTATVVVEYGLLSWAQAFSDDPGGEQSFPNDSAPGEPYIFSECEIDYATEVYTTSASQLQFQGAPTNPPGMETVYGAVRVPISTWRITRHQFPNLPYAKVMAMIGQTNSTTFLGQTAGLVLFDNCRTKQVMTAQGTRCQGWEMLFKVKTLDWNRALRPDKIQWDFLTDSSGNMLYQQIDLRPLMA